MTIQQIYSKLRHGDLTEISKLVGCHRMTVQFVLKGKRSHETDLGQKIVRAASILAENRERVKVELSMIAPSSASDNHANNTYNC